MISERQEPPTTPQQVSPPAEQPSHGLQQACPHRSVRPSSSRPQHGSSLPQHGSSLAQQGSSLPQQGSSLPQQGSSSPQQGSSLLQQSCVYSTRGNKKGHEAGRGCAGISRSYVRCAEQTVARSCRQSSCSFYPYNCKHRKTYTR